MDKLFNLFNILKNVKKGRKNKLQPLDTIGQQLVFNKSTPLTLGIECEFALVNAHTYEPANIADLLVTALGHDNVHKEIFQHMIEITTGVCLSAHQVESELYLLKEKIDKLLPSFDAEMIGSGTLPKLEIDKCSRTKSERYQELKERRQIIFDRFATHGMHVHIGMKDAQSCIRYHNFYMHLLPCLLALSANSPFENGVDTGFASIRPTITESMPIAGVPYQFKTWQEYKDLCRSLARANSISNIKDLWWDIRACPRYGTLEIRICDQPSTLYETMAIVAFIHCLGHWFQDNEDWLDEMPRPSNWRTRDNKWRAMRHGLDAELIVDNRGQTKPIKAIISAWLDRLAPYYKTLEYDNYLLQIKTILENGNGACRQRLTFSRTQNLSDVYTTHITELKNNTPLWDKNTEADTSYMAVELGRLIA